MKHELRVNNIVNHRTKPMYELLALLTAEFVCSIADERCNKPIAGTGAWPCTSISCSGLSNASVVRSIGCSYSKLGIWSAVLAGGRTLTRMKYCDNSSQLFELANSERVHDDLPEPPQLCQSSRTSAYPDPGFVTRRR